MNRRTLLIATLAAHAFVVTSSRARAESVAACVAASEDAQALRDAGRLVDARALLIVCAQNTCPPLVRKDCAEWLVDVAANLPTVVLSARDAAGRDLTDVRVSVDGHILTEAMDGRAVFLDPGGHVLRFEVPGTAPLEQRVILRQGEKNRVVSAVLATASSPSPVLVSPLVAACLRVASRAAGPRVA